ncbi:MAG: hypothetical protein K4445_07705 [Deltaproteobacteria bacterium]|jgi:predicted O-methyltransferase YrrM|nr:hypothetical protein [Syntrophaceae bacterium]
MKNTRTAQDILQLARGFMESRLLLTAAELNLFTLLDEAPATAAALAGRLPADLRGLTILLDALAAMGLMMKTPDGAYRPASDAAVYLNEKSPQSVLPMVLHANSLWKSWSSLTTKVTGSEPFAIPPAEIRSAEEIQAFIGAMHVVGLPMARQIVKAVAIENARNLIDVGGASGTYTIAFLSAAPYMRATLFDRPAVIDLARERLAAEGLISRVRLVAGDFYTDELPGGHDLALVSAIIHQNGPAQNVDLFRKVCRALVSGGRIIIRDHIMAPDRVTPEEGAFFAVNMLVNTQAGSTYTFAEIRSWLEEAGFVNVRLVQTGSRMDGLIEAAVP